MYAGLVECPACGHRSYDPGVGCERRGCGYVHRDPAAEHGWRVDETCTCEEPDVVIVGGSGFTVGPRMCARCRKRAR